MRIYISLITFVLILICCQGKSINFNAEQQKIFKDFVGHDFHTINLKSPEYLNKFKEQKQQEQNQAQKEQLNKFLENNQELKGLIDNIKSNSGYDKVETSIPRPQITNDLTHEHLAEPNVSNALTIDDMIKGLDIKSAALKSFTSFVQKTDKADKKKKVSINKKSKINLNSKKNAVKKFQVDSNTQAFKRQKKVVAKKQVVQRTRKAPSNAGVDEYV